MKSIRGLVLSAVLSKTVDLVVFRFWCVSVHVAVVVPVCLGDYFSSAFFKFSLHSPLRPVIVLFDFLLADCAFLAGYRLYHIVDSFSVG